MQEVLQQRPSLRPAPVVVRSAAEVAEIIASVAAGESSGPLDVRTVVAPNKRVVHAIRKTLLLTQRHDALAGFEGVSIEDLARRVLHGAKVTWQEGEDRLRPLRIEAHLQAGRGIAGFTTEALQQASGWDRAFARTVGELEAAGLRPDDLRATGDPRCLGVAALWDRLDHEAQGCWTRARLVHEARRQLGNTVWRPRGPVFAIVSAETTTAALRLLDALDTLDVAGGVQFVVLDGHPLGTGAARRLYSITGALAPDAELLEVLPEDALHVLQRNLFRRADDRVPPLDLSRACALPDASVRFEQHEGVDAEIESTVRWVSEELMAGTHAEDIAVLVADRVLLDLLPRRLATIGESGDDGEAVFPVHVAGGEAAGSLHGSGPLLRVLRACRDHLDRASMWDLLEVVRLHPPTAPSNDVAAIQDEVERALPQSWRLRRADAFDIAHACGTLGGHPAAPERAREWLPRIDARLAALEAELAASSDDERARTRTRIAHDRLQRLLPALRALDEVIVALQADAPAHALWALLEAFLAEHVWGGDGHATHALGAALQKTPLPSHVCGRQALEAMFALAEGTRGSSVRFGQPAVYVGDLASAAGLRFAAVRIVGLAEGTVPPRLRSDVVLGEDVRTALDLPSRAERLEAARRSFHRAVASATQRLVLSCPRVVDGGVTRAPSPIFEECLRAIGGPGKTMKRLEHAFDAARRAAKNRRTFTPLSHADRHVRAMQLGRHPAHWTESLSCSAERMALMATPTGAVSTALASEVFAGLHPDRPISASRLEKLLGCPYRFLLEDVVRWGEANQPPPTTELQSTTFGSAVHDALERLFLRHGPAIERREGTLEHHIGRGRDTVDEIFDALRGSVALEHDGAWHAERRRAHEAVATFLRHEWQRPSGAWVAAERRFGMETTDRVEIGAAGQSLWVHGKIDRIRTAKRDGTATTEVWDVKTGKCKGRVAAETAPDHLIDLQIGVYALVARSRSNAWGTPARVEAGYVYTNHAKGPERVFVGSKAEELLDATEGWIAVAHDLLANGLFPRTTRANDCTFCHFRPHCGPQATARSKQSLAAEDVPEPLQRFALLKGATKAKKESKSR